MCSANICEGATFVPRQYFSSALLNLKLFFLPIFPSSNRCCVDANYSVSTCAFRLDLPFFSKLLFESLNICQVIKVEREKRF